METVTALILAMLAGTVSPCLAAPPSAPEGYHWVQEERVSDEFNGTARDTNKELDYFPSWQGRPPAKCVPSGVAVANGCLELRAGTLPEPEGKFTVAGAAVRSRHQEGRFGYYEARMKASQSSMSATVWLSGGRQRVGNGSVSQEINITETIGSPYPEPAWSKDWNRFMNSNTHVNLWAGGTMTNYSVGDRAALNPLAGDVYHSYAAWWGDANTVRYYLDNECKFTIHPETSVSAMPFSRPMHVTMVTETCDWEKPPTLEALTNSATNTVRCDWVRAYVLRKQAAAGKDRKVSIPTIVGEYVHVYKPGGDVFPGPKAANLVPGQFYKDWVPNDHCFIKDDSGRWHVFGITHPLTDVSNVHAGEHVLFHAIAPPGTLRESLKEGSWKDLRKILPPSERRGEMPAIHAPWILKREGLFHMVYGPTPIRYATSKDLSNWTPRGNLRGAPSGRDPQIVVWKDIYHLIVCGVHDVRVSTSRDFETWTEHGPILTMQPGVDPESPSIVRYNNTFYLFVCGWDGAWDKKDISGAYQHKTYVFQSDDPLRFELKNQVAVIDAHAPEIFQDEAGDWFVSSAEWPHRGVSIARLVWE